MRRLQKPKQLSLWYLIPLALGLHGLVLSIPIDLQKPTENPRSAPVKLMPLPKQPSPQPTPVKSPIAAAPSPSPQSTPQSAPEVTQPRPATDPQVTAPVTPKPTPSPVTVKPSPSPDGFQIQGAIACEGIKDCYASPETNGRSVASTLEQQLQAQGYTLKLLDLAEDTGMKIYQLSQNGQPKDYLHIIWTAQGTRSLRLPQPVTDWEQLAALAKL